MNIILQSMIVFSKFANEFNNDEFLQHNVAKLFWTSI